MEKLQLLKIRIESVIKDVSYLPECAVQVTTLDRVLQWIREIEENDN